jgi:hypothetical protein
MANGCCSVLPPNPRAPVEHQGPARREAMPAMASKWPWKRMSMQFLQADYRLIWF